MTQIFKEHFVDKYDGVTSPLLLKPGMISDGQNMRKASALGGWKVRKGCTLHHTTALETGAAIKSLHWYEHPRNLDKHFIAQVNSKLYDATNDPPTAGTSTFGATLATANVGTTPGFSTVVNEHWFYADGTARPITWGGDSPFPIGFIVVDTSEVAQVDYTRKVIDTRTDTKAVVLAAATDRILVGSPEIADGIYFDLGAAVNTNASTASVYGWKAGAWANHTTGFVDATVSPSTDTLAVDGWMTWTKDSADTMSVYNGIMAYWYQVRWTQALSNSIDVLGCKVSFDATPMTNKWDGIPNLITGARFFDQSTGEYVELLGKVGNESTSLYYNLNDATTSDMIYVKTPAPATGIGLAVVPEYEQTDNAQFNKVQHWDGDSWEDISTLQDGTLDVTGDSSLARTGWVYWNGAAITSYMRTIPGDDVPGYWYRLRWDAAFTNAADDIRLYYVTYAPFPETLPAYKGCIEFKDRLFLWGDPEYPNRLRYSSALRPDCFVGPDSGYTEPFGDMSELLCCVRFFNELVVFKRNSVWMLEGYNGATFGRVRITEDVGLSSPKTAVVAEGGTPGMNAVESLSVVLWQDVDGVYAFEGRKPKKVSGPVDHYFNPEYTTCIATADIDALQAFVDKANNEYHLLNPNGKELVYSVIRDEWCPPWDRSLDLTTGISLRGTDSRRYSYGGCASGIVMKLENGTNDRNASNTEVAISHYVTSRAISATQKEATTLEFTLRRLWGEFSAASTGSITTTVFKNEITTGTAWATPTAMSLISSGYDYAFPRLDGSYDGCLSFKVKFAVNTAGYAMKVNSILYEIEGRGIKHA